jgi:hypothetical protein
MNEKRRRSELTGQCEPVGQYVDQEAADELGGVERHELVASVGLGPAILPFAGNPSI